jgi:hypothetical protein
MGVQTAGGARPASGGGAAFAPTGGDAPARATSTSAPATLSGLDALIALQAIDGDQPRRRRKAVRRGHDLLDVLEEIKIGLLSGGISGAALDRVAALLGSLEPSGEAGLDDLMADIALRAEVELAKLGRYLDRP